MVMAQGVENDGYRVGLSLERSRREDSIAVFAVPKLDDFKFLYARSFLRQLGAGAVDTALLL